MFKSYFLITLRNFYKQKVYSFINISGLALGLASFILILMYVQSELNFDSHWKNKDRIYRITSKLKLTTQEDYICMSSFMLGPTLKNDYPEVERAIRLMPIGKQTIWDNEKVFELEYLQFTDSTFFDIFDFEFIEGNPQTALKNPESLVLTDESALKIFGTTTGLLGKTLKFTAKTYTITGVIKQNNDNSHLYVTGLLSINSLHPNFERQLKTDWFYMAQTNYLLLKNPENAKNFNENFRQIIESKIKPWLEKESVGQSSIEFQLQPISEIHLTTDLKAEFAKTTNKSYIYIFSFVAFFILIIACINYMNLATARSANRAKEVGIRKTSGALKSQLVQQFIGESLITALASIILALCMVEIFLPGFNNLSGKSISLELANLIQIIPLLLAIVMLVGIISGCYPAFYLSSFNPIQVLKSNYLPQTGGTLLRKILVIIQFSISIAMIFCTLMVFRQMNFLKKQDLGFNNKQMLVLKVPIADSLVNKNLETIKNDFYKLKGIKNITNCNQIPGNVTGKLFHSIRIDDKLEERLMTFLIVDYDFFKTLNLELVNGRNFSKDITTDDTAAFIVNQTAVNTFGWKNIENITLENGIGNRGKIIGVVKDFNFNSLHNPIEPLVIMLGKNVLNNLIIEIDKNNLQNTVAEIEKNWKNYSKRYPTEYFFLDDKFNEKYLAEEKLLKIFTYFSVLTICIACLGLFGLSSFTTEKRTKEIGIRKVMGATSWQIVFLVTKDFLILVCISFVFAFPAGYYFINEWLQSFAYKTNIGFEIFLFTTISTIAIAGFTVAFIAYKATLQNPINSLRYE